MFFNHFYGLIIEIALWITVLFFLWIAHEQTAQNLDFVSSLVALPSFSYWEPSLPKSRFAQERRAIEQFQKRCARLCNNIIMYFTGRWGGATPREESTVSKTCKYVVITALKKYIFFRIYICMYTVCKWVNFQKSSDAYIHTQRNCTQLYCTVNVKLSEWKLEAIKVLKKLLIIYCKKFIWVFFVCEETMKSWWLYASLS